MVFSYCVDLFTSSRTPITIDQIQGIEELVLIDIEASLMRQYSKEEVLVALKSMHPGKSPGSDGLPALSYN